MNVEITSRDKKLLVYLLAIVIVALAYILGARPFLDKTEKNNDKIKILSKELTQLTTIYDNSEMYTQRIEEGKLRIEDAMQKFPAGLTDENTLIMIQDIEDNTGAWISRVSFSEEETAADTVAQAQAEANDETEAIETEDASSEDTIEIEDGGLNPTNIIPVKQNLTLEYRCNYDSFKHFIKYIKEYNSRLFISTMSSRYAPENNEVSGTVVLTQYAVYGTGKEINEPDLSGISTGTDNIFTTLGGSTGLNQGLEIQTLENPNLEGVEDEERSEDEEGLEESNEDSLEATEEPAPQQQHPAAPGII